MSNVYKRERAARHPASPPISHQDDRAHWFESANERKVRAAREMRQWLASEVRLVSNPASSATRVGKGKEGASSRGDPGAPLYSVGYPDSCSLVVGDPWWCEVSLPLSLVFVFPLRKIESSLVGEGVILYTDYSS